jgi:uncharacterized membrane protein YfcA
MEARRSGEAEIMREPHAKRRQLNVGGIKNGIVLIVASIIAAGSAITGLGAHLAYAPSLQWMFGFRPEKAQLVAMRYAACAALSAIIVLTRNGVLSGALMVSAAVIFLGSTVGALLGATFTLKSEMLNARRFFQVVGVGLCVWTLIQASRLSSLNPSVAVAQWDSNGSLFGITVGVGLLAQASRLTSGLLLIPSLYFLGGFSAMQAIGVSLSVVLLATLLPSLSAGRQPLPEPTYLTPSLFGGLIGGIAGGLGLLRLSDKGILIAFAVVAMYLCGQELTRIYYESLPSPQTTPEKEDNR